MGRKRYPGAAALLITADGGGSNGSRCRLWKVALQGLADQLGIPIHVCHFPPGTSKWNKVEHRLFSFISINWRGRPCGPTKPSSISSEIRPTVAASWCAPASIVASTPPARGSPPKSFASSESSATPFTGDWNYVLKPRKDRQ
jgi:hypothetical protein